MLEALSGTCTLYLNGRASLQHLISDAFVALAISTLHGGVMMAQVGGGVVGGGAGRMLGCCWGDRL